MATLGLPGNDLEAAVAFGIEREQSPVRQNMATQGYERAASSLPRHVQLGNAADWVIYEQIVRSWRRSGSARQIAVADLDRLVKSRWPLAQAEDLALAEPLCDHEPNYVLEYPERDSHIESSIKSARSDNALALRRARAHPQNLVPPAAENQKGDTYVA